MTLEEKGIPYQIVEEKLSQLSPELLALHPEGRVPLLIHHLGGHPEVIYQSTVITEYLDEAFPKFPLMPKDSVLRARVRLWTYWCDSIFKPDLDLLKYEKNNLPREEQDQLDLRLHSYFSKWNQALESSQFLVGDELTLADIHLFPFARQFTRIQPAWNGMEKYSYILSWLSRMMERPAFTRAMAKADSVKSE
jgi:glutathione S-transferase